MELSQYVDEIFFFAVGVLAIALGYGGLIGTKIGDLLEHQKAIRLGKRLRIAGPLLIGVSLVLAAAKYHASQAMPG